MSLELVNTFATLGTFVVIAVTAIAAIVQLRHARSSSHIAALNGLRETRESADFQSASSFVRGVLPAKLEDPVFRYQLAVPAAWTDENRPLIAKANLVVYRAPSDCVTKDFTNDARSRRNFAHGLTRSRYVLTNRHKNVREDLVRR